MGNFLPSIDASLSRIEYGESEKLDGKTGYPDDQEVIKVTAKWNLFAGEKMSMKLLSIPKEKTSLCTT